MLCSLETGGADCLFTHKNLLQNVQKAVILMNFHFKEK